MVRLLPVMMTPVNNNTNLSLSSQLTPSHRGKTTLSDSKCWNDEQRRRKGFIWN